MSPPTWHAFYSKTQLNIISRNPSSRVYTNLYKLKDTNEIVEVTSIFSTNKNPTSHDCNMNFSDKKYLGIVDKWIKIGHHNPKYFKS